MDIVLTIPKRRYETHDRILRDIVDIEGSYLSWAMNATPKRLRTGNRVHFVKHGRIEHSFRVFDIQHAHGRLPATSVMNMTTGEAFQGKCILHMDDLQWCEEIIAVNGFQGFRYKWWHTGGDRIYTTKRKVGKHG